MTAGVVPFPGARGERALELSPIKAMERLAAATPGALSLAQGHAPFAPPEAVVRAVREALASPESWRYTPAEGLRELREAIAAEVAADGTTYDPEHEIVVTCGATEALAAALLALVEPGDEVLVPAPAYVSFAATVELARATVTRVPMAEDGLRFRLDLDALAAAVSRRTRAIVLANPSNPTGHVLDENELRGLLELAERHDLTVVLDEVYRHTVFDGAYVPAGRYPAGKDRLVRVYGFGKTYGMCGLRVGYALAPAKLGRRILAAHDAIANSAPHPGQLAALAALGMCREARDGFAARLRPLRETALAGLDMLADLFAIAPPPATYFLLPKIKRTSPFGASDVPFVHRLFAATGVAMVPGSVFGPGGEGRVRLSFAVPQKRLAQAFERLIDAVSASRLAEMR